MSGICSGKTRVYWFLILSMLFACSEETLVRRRDQINPEPRTNSGNSPKPNPTIPSDPGTPSSPSDRGKVPLLLGKTFAIRDGRLLDKSGHEFIMRGVNNPHNYYSELSFSALATIQDMGFNTVRIVWCADTLMVVGRCEQKDLHPTFELKRILQDLRARNLVGVLNLQNATGSDSAADLQAMVDYLLKPEVKQLLLDYQDILLINIANEWYGTWDSGASTVNGENYKAGLIMAIKALRTGGLPHVLVLDAQGYGQYFESIPRDAKQLLGLDPNLLFSAHFYDVFGDPAKVIKAFETIRSNKIPFIVGEFGCVHQPGQPVACETIMQEASRAEASYGYIGWSMSGNNSTLAGLDVVNNDQQWKTLTSWGVTLINGTNGVKATAQRACLYEIAGDGKTCGALKRSLK